MSIQLLQRNRGADSPRRTDASTAQAVPERLADRGEKAGMGGELLVARAMGPRRPHLHPHRARGVVETLVRPDRLGDDLSQPKADLPPPGQLDIALGEELGVDQRAMLD